MADCKLLSSHYVGLLHDSMRIMSAAQKGSTYELARLLEVTKRHIGEFGEEFPALKEQIVLRSSRDYIDYSERLLEENRHEKISDTMDEMQMVLLENALVDVAHCECRKEG